LASEYRGGRGNVIEIDLGLTKVVSVKVDMATLKEIDELYKSFEYRSRSEFIREALIMYMKLLKRFGREGVKKLVNGGAEPKTK